MDLSVARKPGNVITACPSPGARLLSSGCIGMSAVASDNARGASIKAINNDGGLTSSALVAVADCWSRGLRISDYTRFTANQDK
jgi:hypothetical protein